MNNNDLFEDIYYDTILSNSGINEMSFLVSNSVKNILNNIPIVTKKEFIERVEPGDIITAFKPRSVIKKSNKTKVTSKIMASIQTSPYTSSKMVFNKKYVIGYGVTDLKMSQVDEVRLYPVKNIVSERQELCLIKISDATKDQKRKAASYMKSKLGLEYNKSDVLKSVWDRFFNRKIFPFFKDETLDPEVIKEMQRPLFCSSIIALAYIVAGYKKGFNNKHPYDTWPKDFILDDNTEKVCKVEYGY